MGKSGINSSDDSIAVRIASALKLSFYAVEGG